MLFKWWKRWRTRAAYQRLSHEEKELAQFLGVDPDNLIKRGLL